jgi:hypothetical protein
MAVKQISSLAAARAIVLESFDVKRYEPQETKKWDGAYQRYLGILEKK